MMKAINKCSKKLSVAKNSSSITRRSFLSGTAASAGAVILSSQLPSTLQAQTALSSINVVPTWSHVPICQVSASDRQGQGPFFIHNDERDDDVDFFRQDIRGQYNPDAESGTEMHLHLKLLNVAEDNCEESSLAGMEVYIWHCDAQGYYSGFGEPGEQKPDISYWRTMKPGSNDLDNNASFCRGAALSNAEGVVSFKSIFPGWYNGRDVHIHLMVLKPGSKSRGRRRYRGGDHVFTTQFYFEPDLIDRVHRASQPYLRRTSLPDYEGSILGDERGTSGLRAKATFENGVVTAQMQILLETN